MERGKINWFHVVIMFFVALSFIRIGDAYISQKNNNHIVLEEDYLKKYLILHDEATDLLRESIEISVEVIKNKEPRKKEAIEEHLNKIYLMKKEIISKSSETSLIKLQILGVSQLSLAEKVSSYALANYGKEKTNNWLILNETALEEYERLESEKLELFDEILLNTMFELNKMNAGKVSINR